MQGLRLRDLEALLWDYRQCCAADRRRAASLEAALSRLEQGECHRFSHMQASCVAHSSLHLLDRKAVRAVH